MNLFAHGNTGSPSGRLFPPWEAHPATVHFPVAFLLGAAALDLDAWWKGRADFTRVATKLMAASVLTGVVAAATGAVAFLTVPARTRETVASGRDEPLVMCVRLTGLFGIAVLLVGAYLGGSLVYRGGAGVDPAILAPR